MTIVKDDLPDHMVFDVAELEDAIPGRVWKMEEFPRVNTSSQLAQWASNLGNFTDRLKSTGAKLVYATITPYMPEKYTNPSVPGPMNPQAYVETKNALAAKTVKAHGLIAINDLYSVVTREGLLQLLHLQ
jgi:hypothetical protein